MWKCAVLIIAVAAMQSPSPVGEAAPQSFPPEGAFDAQWLILGVNLTIAEKVRLNVSAHVACPQDPHCAIFSLRYTQRFPEGYGPGVIMSTSGERFHASLQVARQRILDTWIDNPSPFADGPNNVSKTILYNPDRDADGDWVVVAFLASAIGRFTYDIDHAEALTVLLTGSSGLNLVEAHEFDALLDAHVLLGQGIAYQLQLKPERGMFGIFHPWIVNNFGDGGYAGPEDQDQCLSGHVLYVGIGSCRGWVLHGGPGAWQFHKNVRAGWFLASDAVWLVYLDMAPPRP